MASRANPQIHKVDCRAPTKRAGMILTAFTRVPGVRVCRIGGVHNALFYSTLHLRPYLAESTASRSICTVKWQRASSSTAVGDHAGTARAVGYLFCWRK